MKIEQVRFEVARQWRMSLAEAARVFSSTWHDLPRLRLDLEAITSARAESDRHNPAWIALNR